MKKTSLTLALLGAFAGSAFAADASIYGVVDYGMSYVHWDLGGSAYDTDTFQMKSGQNSGSRFGIKGSEDLGNGVSVGFVLENGFNADDGTMDNNSRLFGREAQLFVATDYGTLSFGRVGKLISALGSYGVMGNFSVFSGGWGSYTGGKYFHVADWGRMDNTITYRSPVIAGFQLSAQYSSQADTKEVHGLGTPVENKSSTDRIAQIAMTYGIGDLNILVAGEWNNWSNLPRGANGTETDWREKKDGYNAIVGVTYDFDVAKIYATGEYSKHMRIKASDNKTLTGFAGAFGNFINNTGYIDGSAATLGADIPAFGGVFKVDAGYRFGECVYNNANNYTQWAFGAGYQYNLSKRTSVYAATSYTKVNMGKVHTEPAVGDNNIAAYEAFAGLVHKF